MVIKDPTITNPICIMLNTQRKCSNSNSIILDDVIAITLSYRYNVLVIYRLFHAFLYYSYRLDLKGEKLSSIHTS